MSEFTPEELEAIRLWEAYKAWLTRREDYYVSDPYGKRADFASILAADPRPPEADQAALRRAVRKGYRVGPPHRDLYDPDL